MHQDEQDGVPLIFRDVPFSTLPLHIKQLGEDRVKELKRLADAWLEARGGSPEWLSEEEED